MSRRIAVSVVVATIALGMTSCARTQYRVPLRCLHPVVFTFKLPPNAQGEQAAQAVLVQTLAVDAGAKEPLAEIGNGAVKLRTYVADRVRARELGKRILVALSQRYPGAAFVGPVDGVMESQDFADEVGNVIVSRIPSSVTAPFTVDLTQGPNRLDVVASTLVDEGLYNWTWRERGLIQGWLLPQGYQGEIQGRSESAQWPWPRMSFVDAHNQVVDSGLVLRRAALVMSNENPAAEAFVSVAGNNLSVVVTLSRESGKRLNEITGRSVGRTIALTCDGKVMVAPVIRAPFGRRFSIDGLNTEGGTRAAERLAAFFRSGPLPTVVTEAKHGKP